jgi:hypothetical protein
MTAKLFLVIPSGSEESLPAVDERRVCVSRYRLRVRLNYRQVQSNCSLAASDPGESGALGPAPLRTTKLERAAGILYGKRNNEA